MFPLSSYANNCANHYRHDNDVNLCMCVFVCCVCVQVCACMYVYKEHYNVCLRQAVDCKWIRTHIKLEHFKQVDKSYLIQLTTIIAITGPWNAQLAPFPLVIQQLCVMRL